MWLGEFQRADQGLEDFIFILTRSKIYRLQFMWIPVMRLDWQMGRVERTYPWVGFTLKLGVGYWGIMFLYTRFFFPLLGCGLYLDSLFFNKIYLLRIIKKFITLRFSFIVYFPLCYLIKHLWKKKKTQPSSHFS